MQVNLFMEYFKYDLYLMNIKHILMIILFSVLQTFFGSSYNTSLKFKTYNYTYYSNSDSCIRRRKLWTI